MPRSPSIELSDAALGTGPRGEAPTTDEPAAGPTGAAPDVVASGAAGPSRTRRWLRRARTAVAQSRRVRVRQVAAERVRVWRVPGTVRTYHLSDPRARGYVSGVATVAVTDPAALVRLATSGLLRGNVVGLRVRVAVAPRWLVRGLRPPPLRPHARSFTWRIDGAGVRIDLRWSRPIPVRLAFGDALAATMRQRSWPSSDGPVPALDRLAWLDGASTWPQGRLSGAEAADERDEQDRPLGPFQIIDRTGLPARALPPVPTGVANPHGRVLFGAATRYRLAAGAGDAVLLRDASGAVVATLRSGAGVEEGLLRARFQRYAVVDVAAVPPGGAAALRALGACGVVFAAGDPAVRDGLTALGLVAVADPAAVADLPGYALSVAASRHLAVTGDAALRRTPLAGGTLPLPTVSVLLSSMRPDHVGGCLAQLAHQTYPAVEIVVGLHGYDVSAATLDGWRTLVPFPLRVVPFDSGTPFGAVLGGLSRTADGDLLSKVDDDDHYGRHHLTDLVLAAHATGADLVAKGARFVHLPDRDETIDRAWAAPELFDGTPAGGTLLLSRGALQRAGGWSHSSRHVDGDLITRVKDTGGVVYRTHGLEYAYVRRATGHTFATDTERLLSQGRRTYRGLPDGVVCPDYPEPGR